MRRVLLILTLALIHVGTANAQSISANTAPLQKGDKQLNIGLGMGSSVPLFASLDFGVHPDITVTPELSFNLDGFDYLTLGVKGDYHWNRVIGIPSNWDLYTGVGLGGLIRIGDSDIADGFNFHAQLGGRYYWNESWAVMLELNGGLLNSNATFGVSKKL